MFRKFTLSLLTAVILFSSSLSFFATSAQAQWYKPTYDNFVELVEGNGNDAELFGERYTAAQVRWIIWSLVYIITDNEFIGCLKFTAPAVPGGSSDDCQAVAQLFLSFVTTMNTQNDSWAMMFDRSLSVTTYFKHLGTRLHIIPEAQAQGFGFEAGAIVFKIWEISRNISYSLLIIVIIIMAFMIMFRVKLSPQTVITVQSALPKVIITLILITFSYAIAGLLIDLMYVVMGLLTTIILEGGLSDEDAWGTLFGQLTYNNGAFELMFKYLIMFVGALYMATTSSLGGVIATFGTLGLLQPIIIVVAFIVVMILGFRVWWMLLKNFVMIILSISFAPFQILIGALGPGGFSPWVKNFIGLLAVYPITAFMFVLSFIFLRGASSNWITDLISAISVLGVSASDFWPFDVANILSGGNNWTPPLTSGTGDLDIVWLGVSVAILSLIPKTSEMIKGFMTGRPIAYGTAIGEGLAFASGAGSYALGSAKGELGYRSVGWGKALQDWGKAQGGLSGRLAQGAGRGVFAFGERNAMVTRDKATNRPETVSRQGSAGPGRNLT